MCQRTGRDSSVPALHTKGQTDLQFRLDSSQPLFQLQQNPGFNPLAQRAFPDDCNSPACLKQMISVTPVSFHVGMKLGLPELCASGRGCRVRTAGMSMPEAAVNEAYCSKLTKHQIRCAGEFPVVKTISQATSMQSPTESEFGLRIPAADSSHHAGTGSLIHYVRHRRSCKVFREYTREAISRKSSSWCRRTRSDSSNPVCGAKPGLIGNHVFMPFSGSGQAAVPTAVIPSHHQGEKP